MKKFLVLLVALVLVFCMATAYADDGIKVTITPLDPVTGYPTSPTYVKNTEFRLQVDIDTPMFFDPSFNPNNLELRIEVLGVEITGQNVVMDEGSYIIKGVVRELPASVTVKINDKSLNNATTAEQLYFATLKNYTTSATFTFNGGYTTSNDGLSIPKTGGGSVLGVSLCAALCAAFVGKK